MLRENSKCRAGFTLVELAVVLTVIALMIGGILVGRSLIRSAELQSVISDVSRFKQAAKLFRDKYKFLPGDFPNAAAIWGTDTSCDTGAVPNIDGTAANHDRKQATCGGNGNGYIAGYNSAQPSQWPTPSVVGSTSANREAIRAWQHLANAKLVEGAYSGAASDITGGYEPDVNVPEGPDEAGFALFHSSPISPDGETPGGLSVVNVYPSAYGHIIGFGNGRGNQIRKGMVRPALSAADAVDIDGKVDDGKPAAGDVLSFTPVSESPSCASSSDPASAVYRSSEEGVACALIFITGL